VRPAAGADRDWLVAPLGGVIAAAARASRATHPLRVAIDGPDAAGKTTLAEELAASIGAERPVIRASVDGFHHPADVRRRRGPMSAEGYYRDSFDADAVVRSLLDPLGAGGDRRYRSATFDYRTEARLDLPWRIAPDDAVLLFDRVFLLRPELRDRWDFSVVVHVTPAETMRRAMTRDADLMGGAASVVERYRSRYLPGQEIYRAQAHPYAWADVVVDNEDVSRPYPLKWPTSRGDGRDGREPPH
jgi:uridine kinase